MSQHCSDVMGKVNIGLRKCVPQEKIKLTRPAETEGRTFLQGTTSQLREGDMLLLRHLHPTSVESSTRTSLIEKGDNGAVWSISSCSD